MHHSLRPMLLNHCNLMLATRISCIFVVLNTPHSSCKHEHESVTQWVSVSLQTSHVHSQLTESSTHSFEQIVYEWHNTSHFPLAVSNNLLWWQIGVHTHTHTHTHTHKHHTHRAQTLFHLRLFFHCVSLSHMCTCSLTQPETSTLDSTTI